MNDAVGFWAILMPDKASETVGVRFHDFPNIVTYGFDRDHAVEMAGEALNGCLESDYDRHVPLPESRRKPRVKKGEEAVFVTLDPDVRTAYLVRGWREESGLTQAQMARRMDISTQAYQRIERPGRANLTIATLMRVAEAVEKRLVISAE
ncbi:helix-turn-helix domain-containing protein [bacterium]|nr:helix-turn-helix domain-containing protein [bacterium]